MRIEAGEIEQAVAERAMGEEGMPVQQILNRHARLAGRQRSLRHDLGRKTVPAVGPERAEHVAVAIRGDEVAVMPRLVEVPPVPLLYFSGRDDAERAPRREEGAAEILEVVGG